MPQVKVGNLKALAVTGTPDVLLEAIAGKARQAMTAARWAEVLAKDGVEVPPERERTRAYVADEHAFWGRKLKALKIDME